MFSIFSSKASRIYVIFCRENFAKNYYNLSLLINDGSNLVFFVPINNCQKTDQDSCGSTNLLITMILLRYPAKFTVYKQSAQHSYLNWRSLQSCLQSPSWVMTNNIDYCIFWTVLSLKVKTKNFLHNLPRHNNIKSCQFRLKFLNENEKILMHLFANSNLGKHLILRNKYLLYEKLILGLNKMF